jgi:hypothetical protein
VMEQDPDKINDIERQIEQRVFKEGEAYAASHKRSRAENKDRSASRERIKEMGLRTDAYQVGVRIVKDLTALERKAFLQDLELVVRVLGSRQKDLFPEEAMRAEKREQRRKEAEAEAKKGSAGAPDPDKNPRSDPEQGRREATCGQEGRDQQRGAASAAERRAAAGRAAGRRCRAQRPDARDAGGAILGAQSLMARRRARARSRPRKWKPPN